MRTGRHSNGRLKHRCGIKVSFVPAGWRVGSLVRLHGSGRVGLGIDALLRGAIIALDNARLSHLIHGGSRCAQRRGDSWSPRLTVHTALHERLELASRTMRDGRDGRDGVITVRCAQRPSLGDTNLVFSSAEDSTGCCLLLEQKSREMILRYLSKKSRQVSRYLSRMVEK